VWKPLRQQHIIDDRSQRVYSHDAPSYASGGATDPIHSMSERKRSPLHSLPPSSPIRDAISSPFRPASTEQNFNTEEMNYRGCYSPSANEHGSDPFGFHAAVKKAGTNFPHPSRPKTKSKGTSGKRHKKREIQPVVVNIYETLPAVGMDSVVSIPDLTSSPRVLPRPASPNVKQRVRRHALPRKVKRAKRTRKRPAEKEVDCEEFDLDVDEELLKARQERIEYFEELESYQLRQENVYVV